jgi:predicted RNase H-like HicB family nuclease
MNTKIIKVLIEKHDDGSYWGSTQNLPGVIAGQGETLEELKKSLKIAFDDYIDLARSTKKSWAANYTNAAEWAWEYEMNIQSFFDLIPEVKISLIGKKSGINQSLMRQYATGKAPASEARLKKIEATIHELGRELLSVHF